MDNYEQEKQFFYRLKAECNDKTKKSCEHAIKKIISSYNTTIDENRFVVGSVVEVLVYCLFRATHIECFLSKRAICFDRKRLAVQGIFKGGFNDARLINYQGEQREQGEQGERKRKKKRKWETATLFVISDIGIVFGTPNMVESEHLKDTKDALVLKKAGLEKIASDKNNIFSINIARKPLFDLADQNKKASDLIVKDIFRDRKLKILRNAYNSKITGRSVWSWCRLFTKRG